MFSKLMFAAIATLATALPAAALPTYSSSAPTLTAEDIRDFDSSLIFIRSSEDGIFYRSTGFVSSVATDGNLYVERAFALARRDPGRRTSFVTWKQIDCGRMLGRTSTSAIYINDVKTDAGSTDWESFGSTSEYANTCEDAASDRGITWTWYAQ